MACHEHSVIDVHAHGTPETVLRLIEQYGERFGGITIDRADGRDVITLPGAKPLRPLPSGMRDGQSRADWMADQGVATQLIAPWMDIQGNGMAPECGIPWVSALNDAMAEGLPDLRADGRLLASVYPADPAAAVAEMERAHVELGAVGVMLSTHFPAGSAADPELEPFWEAAAGLGLPVVLHPPIEGPASAIPGSAEFRSLYGRPLETTFVAARMVLDGVLSRLPELQVVLVHGGGYLPYQAGRMDQQVQAGKVASRLGDRMPSEEVGRFYFDTAMMAPPAVAFLAGLAPGHLMVGTDGPFTQGSVDVASWLEAVAEPQRAMLAAGTAASLFHVTQREVAVCMRVDLTVNGQARSVEVEARTSLLDLIRDDLGLTGTHVGCEHGVCGCCNVLMDGEVVRSCLVLGVQARGKQVGTVEGLEATDGTLSELQESFCKHHALQCGYCTPGILIAVTALLADNPCPAREQVAEALSGSLCRCTGYQQILEAVNDVVESHISASRTGEHV